MKKMVSSFVEFKQIINRTYMKGYEVFYTQYAFYYRTRKCDFFYSCRSVIERLRVFEMLRKCNVRYCKLEELI